MGGTASALVAVGIALASAVTFAWSTALEHRVAGTAPSDARSSWAVLRYVVTRPLWLFGALLGAVGLGLHALALSRGSLALVQPVMLAGVVMAVPLRAALDRARATRGEMIGVVTTVIGIAAFVVVANPRPGERAPDQALAALCVVVGIAISAGLVRAVTSAPDRHHGMMLGASAGVIFGLTAGLLTLVSRLVADGGIRDALLSWPLWGLALIGLTGVALNQRAYRVSSLSTSMPVLNVVNVVVALLIGVVVFGELPATSWLTLGAQGLFLCLTAAGLVLISRSRPQVVVAASDAP